MSKSEDKDKQKQASKWSVEVAQVVQNNAMATIKELKKKEDLANFAEELEQQNHF